jgi:hypothetical protein
MLIRAMRASHVERWLPEIGKADAVDGDGSISSNNFENVWMIDRFCEGLAPHRCD